MVDGVKGEGEFVLGVLCSWTNLHGAIYHLVFFAGLAVIYIVAIHSYFTSSLVMNIPKVKYSIRYGSKKLGDEQYLIWDLMGFPGSTIILLSNSG